MTATLTTWPARTRTPVPVPLPRLGECPDCADEIRIRGNGGLYAHGCTGDGTTPARELVPTFARWLWMQSKRRDDYTNLATLVAGRHFRACTRSPKITAVDVEWTTADELHDHLHLRQFDLTGSDLMQPARGLRCSSVCDDIETVARLYQQLVDAAGGLKEPSPVVRIAHRPTGWVLPDYTDLADCTTNHQRQQDGQPPCTDTAVWKVVEDYGMHLTIGFYCDADLPAEHRPAA